MAPIILGLNCLLPSAVLAEPNTLDFATAYQEALANDASFAAARAAREASRNYVPQARAGLLPSIQVSGSVSSNRSENTSPDIFGKSVTQDSDYYSQSHQLVLKQPIWRPSNWAQYRLAQAQEAYAEAQYRKDWQALVDRLNQAYLDTLQAEQDRELARVQSEALAGQHDQAKRFFAAGEGTRTDVDEARARYDLAKARLLEAENGVEIARRGLQEIIGRLPGPLSPLLDSLPLKLPDGPANVDSWVEAALESSPEVAAEKANVEAAQSEVKKAQSGHHPTLDLVAGRSRSESAFNDPVGSIYDTTYVGVQYALSVYAGGGVDAGIRIAEANLEKARQQLEATSRTVATQVRKVYASVVTGEARIRALALAAHSAEVAVQSARRGFEAGVRTQVDILNALDQRYTAQREHLGAVNEFAKNWLLLQIYAGTMNEAGIDAFAKWFAPAS
jgi:outer membrane protein/protease secretion system outer membrane protein